jgi:hypothetical protein
MTYIDKAENMLRIPAIQKNKEEHKKRRLSKKSPKRTIQKIIKKNRSRRKLMNQATSMPTNAPMNGDLDKFYAQEEMAQKNENFSTTQVNQKKKRKWNRITRYPMPFHKLQPMKEHKRSRRSDERRDLFIFTDLDEMEFLNNDVKDVDVINAHVKKYW